jgi:HAD superfamily hydrolase (TIGR01459 family)
MSAPRLISGLSEIADRYDAVLSDVWGVIHNGRESFPQATEALQRFRDSRGPVVLISNAPRPADAVLAQLDELGVPRAAWSAFVTSGDATRAELQKRGRGPVWAIGPDRDRPLFEGLDLEFSGPEEAQFICVTGPYDDERDRPEDYLDRLAGPAARKLPMICANPDRVVQRGDRLIYCAGALADVYEALGGPVVMVGKPFEPIYDLACAEAAKAAGGQVSRVLAIGDAVPTDVKGANRQGLDCLFVARGIHAADLADPLEAADVGAVLAREGGEAAYALSELRW